MTRSIISGSDIESNASPSTLSLRNPAVTTCDVFCVPCALRFIEDYVFMRCGIQPEPITNVSVRLYGCGPTCASRSEAQHV